MLNLSKLGKSKICLFLLGMVIIQASYGQINQITKIASVPVTTEYQVAGSYGIRDFTWMVENWPKLYVSYTGGIQEINTETLSVTTMQLPEFPVGMCLDKATGRIATINKKTYSNSEIPFTLTDPATKSRQSITVKTSDGEFVSCNVCAFGADGKTLYFGSNVRDYPQSSKLIAVDTVSWKVAWTWKNANQVNAILPLTNGKVYFVTEYEQPYPNSVSNLQVLDLDGQFKKVDLGGLMPKTLNLGPNGHLNVSGLEIDPTTDEVLDVNYLGVHLVSWTSRDANFVYSAGSGPLEFLGLANRNIIAYINNVTAHGLATKRQPDGSDSIAVLSDNRVDFYKYTPDVPVGVITAVADLYYGVAPVASTRFTEGDVITVWGQKLCVNFPIPLQLPYPNPLRKEIAECSVLLVDSKGTNFLGSLYIVANGNQINVQLPFGLSGIVKMSVKNGSSTSSPVFLSIKGKPSYVQYAKDGVGYLATLHNSDGSLVTAENPLKPGEVIQIYAVGMGETSPVIPAGELGIAPIVGKVEAVISGIPADVIWAGLQGQWPGLDQANVIVPEGVTGKPPTVALKVTFKDGTVHESPIFLLESPK